MTTSYDLNVITTRAWDREGENVAGVTDNELY